MKVKIYCFNVLFNFLKSICTDNLSMLNIYYNNLIVFKLNFIRTTAFKLYYLYFVILNLFQLLLL